MWRLLSWTFRINLFILLLGIAIYFFRSDLGIVIVTLSMTNLGLREKTQLKIKE